MYISEKQKTVISHIKKLNEWKGDNCRFIQHEIPGLTAHTINALYSKGFLTYEQSPLGLTYYQWTGKELD